MAAVQVAMRPARTTSRRQRRYRAALRRVQTASNCCDPPIVYDDGVAAPPRHDCVYLLHFKTPLHGKRHYLGVTSAERITARMQEHSNGRGAVFTRRMMQVSDGFYLARLWIGEGYDLEAKIKRTGHLSSYCPICRLPSAIDDIGFSFFRSTIPPANWKGISVEQPT